MSHTGDGARQPLLQGAEIKRAIVFVYLYRIAATHRDVWLRLAFQVGEIVPGATPAIWTALDMHGLKMTGPHI